MGGGGGGSVSWPRDTSPDDILRSSLSAEQRITYEAELNVYLQDLLVDFNNRDIDQVNTHLETIKDALTKENVGSISLRYGGSIKKHTYVDGLSDIDILAIIDKSDLVGESPSQVLNYFANRLRERLPNTEIKTGALAVTVRFSDGHEIQVLPAISTKVGIRIANDDGISWSNVIKPEKFAQKLTDVNKANNHGVVPVIKLFKAINAKLPGDVKLSGYHIESIAIKAFENYSGTTSRKDMLLHLSQFAPEAVLEPIKDSTGQSIHVDDKLGAPRSFQRQKASASLKRIVARMKLADSEGSLQRWKEMFGE